jgi:TRAP transporter TAXI family solute receptor
MPIIMLSRREVFRGAAMLATMSATGSARAQTKFFRIGTGGTGGTYYPVGGMVANAISSEKLNVSAVSTAGSVANINGIIGGSMESGFSQADVNYWAHTGTGLYEGKPKVEELRAICHLFPEHVHITTRKGLGAKTVADLKGKRVSLLEIGSGSLVNSRAILSAYGLSEKDIKPEYLNQVQSAEKMKDGSVDAFIQTTGYPQGTLVELSTTNGIELVPIDGAPAAKLLEQFKFFSADEIPAGAYKGVPATKTLVVGAQWVTTSKQPEEVVYEVTKALWSDKTRASLDAGHAKGKSIRKESALKGIAIPLHPGAEKYYRQAGLLK